MSVRRSTGTPGIAAPRGEAGDDRVHGAIPFPHEIHGRGVAQPLVFEAAHEREDLAGQGVRMVGQPGELAGERTQHVLVAGLEVLAGTPEWVATTFVGGLKHLPVRYTVR
jgi:hypothetical protein